MSVVVTLTGKDDCLLICTTLDFLVLDPIKTVNYLPLHQTTVPRIYEALRIGIGVFLCLTTIRSLDALDDEPHPFSFSDYSHNLQWLSPLLVWCQILGQMVI